MRAYVNHRGDLQRGWGQLSRAVWKVRARRPVRPSKRVLLGETVLDAIRENA